LLKAQAGPVTQSYRTIFISDVHLGTPDCQAELLIDFLREHDAPTIYLVGDIIDCWRMKRKGFYWPQSHNDVVQKLLRKARKGTRIVYVPGNHDELLRDYQGIHFGGIEVLERDVFETADGNAVAGYSRRRIRHGRYEPSLARPSRRHRLRRRHVDQQMAQPHPQAAGSSLLVVFPLGQAQGQKRGQFHLRFRGSACR
jgi:UDP-2,3-diacylglucosamine pyrophosphatase LpxH